MIRIRILIALLLVLILGCNTENLTPKPEIQKERSTRGLSSADIPEVISVLSEKLGLIDKTTPIFGANQNVTDIELQIDWDRITEVINTENKTSYTFAIEDIDGVGHIFYNLVITKSSNGQFGTPFLLKYEVDESQISKFYRTGSFSSVQGKITKTYLNYSFSVPDYQVNLGGEGDIVSDPCPPNEIEGGGSDSDSSNDDPSPDPIDYGGDTEGCTYYIETVITLIPCEESPDGAPVGYCSGFEEILVIDCGDSGPSNDSSDSNPCPTEDGDVAIIPEGPCNTGSPIVDDTSIQASFTNLWQGSNAESPMAQRLEQGGWIIDSGNGDYTFQALSSDWAIAACGLNPPSNLTSNIPSNAVGFVHSHPFFAGEDRRSICGNDVEAEYKSGFSIDDLQFLAAIAGAVGNWTFKGYVIDGNMITEFNALGQKTQYTRCGY